MKISNKIMKMLNKMCENFVKYLMKFKENYFRKNLMNF